MIKPPPNVLDLPLLDRAQMAMKAAIEKLIEEHAREGLPLYLWRDGKVVAVPAKELLKGNGNKKHRHSVSTVTDHPPRRRTRHKSR